MHGTCVLRVSLADIARQSCGEGIGTASRYCPLFEQAWHLCFTTVVEHAAPLKHREGIIFTPSMHGTCVVACHWTSKRVPLAGGAKLHYCDRISLRLVRVTVCIALMF